MPGNFFGRRPPPPGVRVPRYPVSRFHPDRLAEAMRSIKQTIALHGAGELTATERAIWNSAEIIEVFSASPKNNFGQGHKVEHWPSAIAGLLEMGLPEVADIARETLRIKSMQAELEAGDGPDQDRTTERLLIQTRRFIQIEKTTDFAKLHRQFIDRFYQWG